jgi:hypothetical protein
VLIGIVGIAGSGKTLVAKHLVEHRGYTRMRFADPLKRMLRDGLGLTDEEVDGDMKSTPNPVFAGRTPRYLMQTLGTEWGRKKVSHDIWVNIWKRDAALAGDRVVVDDVRFSNEADAIRALGGTIWRVYRPGIVAASHASEQAQAEITEDVLITNATTISALLSSVEHLLGKTQ